MTKTINTKTLLVCGVIAGPLFVVAFLVEGATRAHYDPLRHPVSSLALGDSHRRLRLADPARRALSEIASGKVSLVWSRSPTATAGAKVRGFTVRPVRVGRIREVCVAALAARHQRIDYGKEQSDG